MSDDPGRLFADLGLDKLPSGERDRLLDEFRKTVAEAVKTKEKETPPPAPPPPPLPAEEEPQFERFALPFRIQHIILFTSCIILIITGIPLKFAGAGWADLYFTLTGGLTINRIIHRVGAGGLIFVGIFHLSYIFFTRDGWKNFKALLPMPKDFVDVFHNMKYFLGLSRHQAKFGRFSYVEKFDYWAVYWGMVVMIGSGLILWFTDISLQMLPKYALDMAAEAHSDEALLATLAIIIWHFYNVHFNPDNFPMNWTWWTGKISESDMKHHHPLEYEEMMKEKGDESSPSKHGRQTEQEPEPKSP